jgi:hypothetical protein
VDGGELYRIERRLIEVEALLRQVILSQARLADTQERLLQLLMPPSTYPASTGGTISVT